MHDSSIGRCSIDGVAVAAAAAREQDERLQQDPLLQTKSMLLTVYSAVTRTNVKVRYKEKSWGITSGRQGLRCWQAHSSLPFSVAGTASPSGVHSPHDSRQCPRGPVM